MDTLANGIRLKIDITPVVNYALQQNRVPILQELVICNETPEPLNNVTLKIWSEPEIVTAFMQNVDVVPASAALSLKAAKLSANSEFLAGLSERLCGNLHAALLKNEDILVEETREITALAFDEWPGTAFFPELLASFVTPNHPEAARINAYAAELLGKWTGDPSLNAYQTKNPNRVLTQAAAVYGAFQAQNIVYSVPPASFEAVGQRVRLCDAVMQQKMGTCLDLTLFYASCLEAIGLHPLLLTQRGHIFAGVWLDDLSFPEAVQDDPALVTKRLAEGINEIAVVECTAFVSGKNIGFDDAMSAAVRQLSGADPLEYIIDVSRARLVGVRPLPLRIQSEHGWRIEKEERDGSELTHAPLEMGAAVRVTEGNSSAAPDKVTQWERKLLDLGLRNTLINMRLTQNVVPIFLTSLGDLEDALADGSEYGIGPRPMEWKPKEDVVGSFEVLTDTGEIKELLKSEFQNKRLRSNLSEGELARAVVGLYRSSKISLEENGANTLYLALGLLRWYETKSSQKPRYAPLVLLPVEIVRKSANRGYIIRLRDDEPQMNITVLEMLKQDFGIIVTGLDPLPLDEHGIDIRGVFAVLRKAVMDQNRWDVIESAFLGIFSFSQFVMWNDMRHRTDDLKANKIVRSLIDGRLQWDAEPMAIGARVPEDNVLLPIPADASQLYAIEAAAKGESFVLHGPPGTGKSQTITALIVNALAQGKTVLFVAEKMAALTVVQKRLNALGIGPFCLELHSNKSKKRDVLEQLRLATEVTKLQPSELYASKAEQTARLRKELDAYAGALHKTRRSGLSLFEMISGFEKYRGFSDAVTFSSGSAASVDAALMERQKLLVERLAASARAVGHPCGHPLRYVGKSVYSQQIKSELTDTISRYQAELDNLEIRGARLAEGLGITAPAAFPDWERLYFISRELETWFTLPHPWAQYADLRTAATDIQTMVQHYLAVINIYSRLSPNWTDALFSQNGTQLLAQWNAASSQWFLSKAIKQSGLIKLLAAFSKSGVRKETLSESLNLLAAYQYELAEANKLFSRYGNDLGDYYQGGNTNWPQLAALAASALMSAENLVRLTGGDAFRKAFAGRHDLFAVMSDLRAAYEKAAASKASFYGLLDIRFTDEGNTGWIAGQRDLCRDISEHSTELKEWIAWQSICREAVTFGLEPMVKAYCGGLGHDEVLGAYCKAIYTALINDVTEHDLTLNTFSGALFNEKIEQFKRLDAELSQLARTETFCRLAGRVPNFTKEAAQSSEVGILQRAVRSGGRGISIRKLFEQIPNLLPRLCPCMLMSPISAAQYLDPKRPPFDLVVFDEASQMPTCKAVGALARGRNAVVVGDPKQMPPTSFFVGNTPDEEALECEDLESILDDCLALNMPDTHLLWHYRSRHESLIAFSNSQFYENRLFTFPSVNDRESKVSLVPVDGWFDRGNTRQNRAEAEAVVKELLRRCHDDRLAGLSVGVVTFNLSQQNLIDDLFTEACKTDPALEAWAYEAEEPLFIKNLENVQGDERDVILFSIGYGPDAQGKVTMNFGPLNREGGWRRLNVAVSRARHQMTVFSTLTPDKIDLSRSAAAGVAALKAFLAYAGGAGIPAATVTAGDVKEPHNSICEKICLELAKHGYNTQRMIGHSEYRIDVGVVDPKNPERYLLGILLDGPVYGLSKTTRDRELAQISVLNGLGWEIRRLWTVDWWDNSQKELNGLLAHLDRLKVLSDQAEPVREKLDAPKLADVPDAKPSVTVSGAYREVTSSPSSTVKTYCAAVLPARNMTPEEFMLPQVTRLIQEAIMRVLQVEAPVSESLLTKRVLQSFGISRAGSRIQSRTGTILENLKLQFTFQDGQRFYWADTQNPNTYLGFRASGDGENKREAKDLPVQEAANAACVILREQVGLPSEDLIRETARILGYTRSGNVVMTIMSDGIRYAIARGKITENAAGYLSAAE